MSVLIIGDVMRDILVKPEGAVVIGADRRAAIQMMPGGSAANQAVWLAAEGIQTTFAGRVGRADLVEQTRLFADAGVAPVLACDDEIPTGTLVVLIAPDGERSFLTDRGANDRLCRADLPDSLLDGARLVHVSGYSLFDAGPRAAILALLDEVRLRAIPFSVDPGSHSFLTEAGAESFLRWTDGARIAFPNAEEAAVLAGTDDPETQLDRLAQSFAVVVIKRGGEGAIAAAGSRRWRAPARVMNPVDTSGAGDAFAAAFLAAHLRDEPIDAALARAVEAGSRAVTRIGARPPVPD